MITINNEPPKKSTNHLTWINISTLLFKSKFFIKTRVKEILLQHLCQKEFARYTGKIQIEFSHLEVFIIPLYK